MQHLERQHKAAMAGDLTTAADDADRALVDEMDVEDLLRLAGAAHFLERPPTTTSARKTPEKTPAKLAAERAAEKRKREAEAAVTPAMKKARIDEAAVAIARQPQRNAENRVPGKK